MLNKLASHNQDIQKLLEKGYAISFDSNYLVVRDVPYLDEHKALKIGAIVSKLVFVDSNHVALEDHQVFFCGSHPHESDGMPIKNLGGGAATLALESADLVVERSFSNKPVATGVFEDFFHKIESYVTLIAGPAIQLYPSAKYLTFRTADNAINSVFKFNDTLTSRAEIGELSIKFKDDIVAIIGLGGTGAYILDLLAKTPVKEIRGFDGDTFHVHTGFRSPGKLEEHEFAKTKAEVYQARYEPFRHGVNLQSKYIAAESIDDLKGTTFGFVCVDKGTARAEIFDVLLKLGIPFIDVGMGFNKRNGPIDGMIRMTYFSHENAEDILAKKLVPMHDEPDDVYRSNIQLAELNALNACLAVMRFKQLRGFYADDAHINHMLMSVHNLHVIGE